jgi:Zn-dependent M16 (insulinase) family peptidase
MFGTQAMLSFIIQVLKGVESKDYQAELLEKCQAVTKEDVLNALRTHFLPLFDPASSIAVVVTSPSKVDHIEEALKTTGFDVEKRTLEVDTEDCEGSESSKSDPE